MRRFRTGLGIAIIATLCATSAFTQEKPGTKAAAKPEAAGEFKPRLPGNYGKLNLTEDQKAKVYAVQVKYNEEMDKLAKQLADLKAKVAMESEAVLTAEQKTKLAELRAAAKKPAAKAPAAEAAKPAATPTTKKP